MTTTRLALPTPILSTSPTDIPADLLALANQLDLVVTKFKEDITANRPAAGTHGYLFWDTTASILYYDDGTVWRTVGSIADGSVTIAKFDSRIPNPNLALGLEMIEGVLPYNGLTGGNPQTQALIVAAVSSWDISIAAGRALIQGDDNTAQGMYLYTRAASANFTLGTHAPATNPRWDIIGLQYNDPDFTGNTPAGLNVVQTVGTPNASAAIGNFAGLPAVPASTLALAQILVKVGDTGVVGGQIIDLRKLAGPGIWGEDGHRYRLGVDSTGTLGVEQVV